MLNKNSYITNIASARRDQAGVASAIATVNSTIVIPSMVDPYMSTFCRPSRSIRNIGENAPAQEAI